MYKNVFFFKYRERGADPAGTAGAGDPRAAPRRRDHLPQLQEEQVPLSDVQRAPRHLQERLRALRGRQPHQGRAHSGVARAAPGGGARRASVPAPVCGEPAGLGQLCARADRPGDRHHGEAPVGGGRRRRSRRGRQGGPAADHQRQSADADDRLCDHRRHDAGVRHHGQVLGRGPALGSAFQGEEAVRAQRSAEHI